MLGPLKPRRIGLWVGFAFLLLLVAAAAQQAKAPQTKSKTDAAASNKASGKKDKQASDDNKTQGSGQAEATDIDESQFTGTDACKDCHEEIGVGFAKNPHAKTLTNKRLDRQGCESCHGPGRSHADAGDPANIINFSLLPRPEASQKCSLCHVFTEGHSTPTHLQHSKTNIGCLDCHSVHAANAQEHLLKSEKPKLCATCHQKLAPSGANAVPRNPR